jgi:tetratricopeptide (TPR) repeat protein
MLDLLSEREKAAFSEQVSSIYLSNYRFAESLRCLQSHETLSDEELNRKGWFGLISLADSYAGLRDYLNAHRLIERVFRAADSALIRNIALQARGEYLVQGQEPVQALPLLKKAVQFYDSADTTADHGLALKWLGACLISLKRFEDAGGFLDRALKILWKPGYKPEGWIEVLEWKGRAELALTGRSDLLERVRALRGSAGAGSMVFSKARAGAKPLTIHIDRESDCKSVGSERILGLDLTDLFNCSLIYAGSFGLPQFRMYDLLWPDEPFSFSQHQKRIEQLALRVRQSGVGVRWKGLHFRMDSRGISCTEPPRKVVKGLRFLKENREFSRSDVEAYFDISRASAILLCRQWVRERLVSSARGRYRYINRG